MFDMFAFKITVSITCFENDALKLSVNEANFRGFRASNCATIEQVLILNFAFGPEKLPHLSRNVLLPHPPPPTPRYFFRYRRVLSVEADRTLLGLYNSSDHMKDESSKFLLYNFLCQAFLSEDV